MTLRIKPLIVGFLALSLANCTDGRSTSIDLGVSTRWHSEEDVFEIAEGARLGYASAGNGKNTLILLHGFGARSDVWREFYVSISGGGVRYVALDLIGHGRSATSGWTNYTVLANASAMAAFIKSKSFDRPVIVGHSLGGLVAIATAQELRREGRSRPRALVLIAAPVYPVPYPRFVTAFRDRTLLSVLIDQLPARLKSRRVLRELFYDDSLITDAMVTSYAHNLEDAASLDGVRKTARQLDLAELESFSAKYNSLNMPILVIGGEADKVVPPDILLRFAASVEGVTLVMVPKCGHLLLDECPDAVESAISRFLQSLD